MLLSCIDKLTDTQNQTNRMVNKIKDRQEYMRELGTVYKIIRYECELMKINQQTRKHKPQTLL